MRRIIPVIGLLLSLWTQGQPGTGRQLPRPSVLPATPVKDQNLSSTCWSFSTASLLESELLRLGKGQNDLSEMFIARYSMRRKIERHLQLKGTNFFTPGGQFHDAVWVMKQYGMMPEEVYTGRGRGEQEHDHSEMDTLLAHFVQELLDKGQTSLSAGQQVYVDSILDHFYGPVPNQFLYKGRTYTPRSYLTQYLGIDPEDYVEITSYTHHPFYRNFVLEDKYNWTGDAYWNVSLDDFRTITRAALDSGYTVGWDGDADDPDFRYFEGKACREKGRPVTQAERQAAFESKETLLDHMMHITGRTKGPGTVWYYIKNSWGDHNNPLAGYLYMCEDYFLLRTVAIIVNKNAVPRALRLKMGF